jgi:signal transduction histidine kinase
MDEILRRLAPELEEGGVVIRVDRPLPRVDADRVLLEQALSNLLANAIKFTAPGRPARVNVRGTSAGGRVRLWIEDEGIGIDPRFHDRLFRVFERLTPSAYPGTGIGLAIVKRVAERLGGTVGVESTPGSGSRFWIELTAAS